MANYLRAIYSGKEGSYELYSLQYQHMLKKAPGGQSTLELCASGAGGKNNG